MKKRTSRILILLPVLAVLILGALAWLGMRKHAGAAKMIAASHNAREEGQTGEEQADGEAPSAEGEQDESPAATSDDGESKEGGGGTPLHMAAYLGQTIVARLLIATGSDVNARDKNFGAVPLHAATFGGHLDMVKLLVDKGATVNPKPGKAGPLLGTAADRKMAEFLIGKGADPKARSTEGWTALHFASILGRKDVVELLLSKGLEVTGEDKNGITPLHAAAGGGHLEIVELFVAKGADVNAVERTEGSTPLTWAIKGKRIEVADFLRRHGATEPEL